MSMRHAGARFVVGFVSEEGKPVVNEISTGASAIFPVGELSIENDFNWHVLSKVVLLRPPCQPTHLKRMVSQASLQAVN